MDPATKADRASLLARRFHWIDLARSLAAVSVLFWHYQHFYFTSAGERSPDFSTASQPLYAYLAPFYEHGHYSVQLFWAISGFVFCAVYVGKDASTRTFVWNRIARLYPLHLLTLVVVAGLQVISTQTVGYEQIYGNNDIQHFLLQLLFASNWLDESGFSFNAPIWSVSVEVLIYGLFWVSFIPLLKSGLAGYVGTAACFFAVRMAGLPGASIAECGGYFFSGCAIFLLFTRYASRPAMLFAFAGAFICLGVSILPGSFGVVGLIVGGLMMIAGAEASAGSAAPKSLRWFGDATYGIYLWHAPLQIIALIILDSHGSRAIVDSPWFLTGFIVMVVGVGHFSYVYVEAPARRRITRLAVGREPAASACSKPVSTTLMHPRCSTLR